jgi:hypothetical protein
MTHTPTPWKQDKHCPYIVCDDDGGSLADVTAGFPISEGVNEANAAFIVQAVNAYKPNQLAIMELVEALKEVMGWIDNWEPEFTEAETWEDTECQIRAVLSKHTQSKAQGEIG